MADTTGYPELDSLLPRVAALASLDRPASSARRSRSWAARRRAHRGSEALPRARPRTGARSARRSTRSSSAPRRPSTPGAPSSTRRAPSADAAPRPHDARAAPLARRRAPRPAVIDEISEIFRELGFTSPSAPRSRPSGTTSSRSIFPPTIRRWTCTTPSTSTAAGDRGTGCRAAAAAHPHLAGADPHHAASRRRSGSSCPGMVYRSDPFDASHAPAFAQIEGLAVDEGISFVDLKATLTHFARRFFAPPPRCASGPRSSRSPSRRRRWTCSASSATAPAAPRARAPAGSRSWAAAWCIPRVLENCGLDAERYTGLAFGMGPARIAMLRYGIPDIRLLYDGDMRFLAQFARGATRRERLPALARGASSAAARRAATSATASPCSAPGRRDRAAPRRARRHSWSALVEEVRQHPERRPAARLHGERWRRASAATWCAARPT